jgi:hypothetical protein
MWATIRQMPARWTHSWIHPRDWPLKSGIDWSSMHSRSCTARSVRLARRWKTVGFDTTREWSPPLGRVRGRTETRWSTQLPGHHRSLPPYSLSPATSLTVWYKLAGVLALSGGDCNRRSRVYYAFVIEFVSGILPWRPCPNRPIRCGRVATCR